jgi:hypothetical protein
MESATESTMNSAHEPTPIGLKSVYSPTDYVCRVGLVAERIAGLHAFAVFFKKSA